MLTASPVLHSIAQAEDHIAAGLTQHGPPRLTGLELEHIVRWADAREPDRPTPDALAAALGPYLPPPHGAGQPLPSGCRVNVEPGGQLELATPPHARLDQLVATTDADLDLVGRLLGTQGIVLTGESFDPRREPLMVFPARRYRAMISLFDRVGSAFTLMLCNSASVQINVDAGDERTSQQLWRALRAMGPVLLAMFANTPDADGWRSGRMRPWFRVDPRRTGPVPGDHLTTAYPRFALAAPVCCVRRSGDDWTAPAGLTFAAWIRGALRPAPTVDDLDYHLTTLFPWVRPRGYLEIRYLDAQPANGYDAPLAVVAAALSDGRSIDAAIAACEPAAGAWRPAARFGLCHPLLARCAADLLAATSSAAARTNLAPQRLNEIWARLDRRIATGEVSR